MATDQKMGVRIFLEVQCWLLIIINGLVDESSNLSDSTKFTEHNTGSTGFDTRRSGNWRLTLTVNDEFAIAA